jgi:hypothetical protein
MLWIILLAFGRALAFGAKELVLDRLENPWLPRSLYLV